MVFVSTIKGLLNKICSWIYSANRVKVCAVYPFAMGGLADLERCVSSQENLREKVRALTE